MQNIKNKPHSVVAEQGANNFYTRANGRNVRPSLNTIISQPRDYVNKKLKKAVV